MVAAQADPGGPGSGLTLGRAGDSGRLGLGNVSWRRLSRRAPFEFRLEIEQPRAARLLWTRGQALAHSVAGAEAGQPLSAVAKNNAGRGPLAQTASGAPGA